MEQQENSPLIPVEPPVFGEAPVTEAPEREPFWGWMDVAMFAAVFLLMALIAVFTGQILGSMIAPQEALAARAMLLQVMLYAALFSALYLVLRARYGRPFWKSLGWVTRWPNAGMLLLAGPAMAFGVAVLGAALKAPQIKSPLEAMLKDPVSIALVGITAVTIGPLAEEILFRGFLLPLLVRTTGTVLAVILCGLPFTLLHGPQYQWSWQHLLLLLIVSVLLSLVRLRTGSTAAATLVHALYNMTFMIFFVIAKYYGKDTAL